MAAAVYLHNALFGQPSSSRSLSNDRPGGNAHDDTRGDSDDSDEEVEENAPLETPHLDLGSSRAPSSSSPFSTATTAAARAVARTHSTSDSLSNPLAAHPQFNTPSRFNTPPQPNSYNPSTSNTPPIDSREHERDHARGTSTSSQTTLVVGPTSPLSSTSPFPWSQPTSPFPWSQVQGHPWSQSPRPQSQSHPSSQEREREREPVEAPPPWSTAQVPGQGSQAEVQPWSPAQAQSRARYYAQRSSAYQPTPTTTSSRREGLLARETRRGRDEGDDGRPREPVDLSTDIDTDTINNNNNNNTASVHVYTSATHHDTTHPNANEEEQHRDTTNPSPLPPGLPPSTSRTSERRPLTPYPWPPISTAADGDGGGGSGGNGNGNGNGGENAENRKSRSHSRGRPKGRRRDDATDSNPANRSSVPAPASAPALTAGATTSHPRTTSSYFTKRPRHSHSHHDNRYYLPPYLRKGRIPNIAFSRCARIAILTVRFLLGVLLCGWAAYSCARYWLAYSEFRPVAIPDSNSTDTAALAPATVAVEDPPRSQYAFALAITCTIATALFVLDSSYFLYFVLYPHDGRLLVRIPTIAPISRTNDEGAAPDDAAADTDTASPPPRPRPPRPQVPIQLQDDKFTSMPYRSSVLSTSSGFRRSRRLSKPRPDSFPATYPPVGREASHAGGEEDAVRDQAANVDTDEQEATNARPSRSQEQERQAVIPAQENVMPPPPSRFVEAPPSTAPGDESDPQVEKHSKRTYTLHLPSLCHEPSISPLPFPPTHVTPIQRDSTQHNDPPRRSSRKWRRTRMFLHIIHWLAFISLNIPGFVNVGLVPVWYQPTQTTDVTGVNSPHRLSGLCVYSPDVIWAGTALPPSRPPPCAQTIPYKVWLWGAIGRILVTFALSGLWIIMDGVWWGAWVVGTRRIGWQGALGGPWRPRRVPRSKQQQGPEEDSEGLPSGEVKESPWAKRIRLLSGASKASGRSGRSGKSGKSNKEKIGEFGARTPPNERGSAVAPAAAASAALGAAAIGIAGGVTNFGVDPQDALSSPTPKHKVKRKPVNTMTSSSSSSNSPTTATYSLNSPPPSSTYGPGGKSSYFEQSRTTGGALGSRRPSVQDSIGGSTVVGSPPGATYLPGSPVFAPISPPASSSHHRAGSVEEQPSFGNAGRRSMALEIVPERSSDERESSPGEQSPELERRYPDRPQSRLAQYDDAAIFGAQYRDRPGAHSPPSSPTYPPSPTRPGWTADPNTFSPITSPDADVPLLGRGYFMVGDGGFLAGNANDGAYDEDSYYRAMSTAEEQAIPFPNPAGPSGANRATSPNSERSNSPNSYGHGQYAGVDVRVETPTNGGDEEYSPEVPSVVPVTQGQWYMPSTSQQPAAYQHPLAQGIQMAMGHPPEFEREVRMLGGVVRRMSTIESFGSHERELSRRGSAATARTTQTGRGNSGGTAQREGTNGSGNSVPMNALAMTSGNGTGSGDRSGGSGSGSGGQMERNPEAEASVGFVRMTSPTDMSPV